MAVLGDAFEEAAKALRIRADQTERRGIVAQLIVQAALQNRDLNADGLRKQAVAAFTMGAALDEARDE
jgi:hypothetical protein